MARLSGWLGQHGQQSASIAVKPRFSLPRATGRSWLMTRGLPPRGDRRCCYPRGRVRAARSLVSEFGGSHPSDSFGFRVASRRRSDTTQRCSGVVAVAGTIDKRACSLRDKRRLSNSRPRCSLERRSRFSLAARRVIGLCHFKAVEASAGNSALYRVLRQAAVFWGKRLPCRQTSGRRVVRQDVPCSETSCTVPRDRIGTVFANGFRCLRAQDS